MSEIKFEIEERDGRFRWVVGGAEEYYLAGEWNESREGARQDGDLLRALIDESVETGANEERAAIVRWLRTCDTANNHIRRVLDDAARCIEEDEHHEQGGGDEVARASR